MCREQRRLPTRVQEHARFVRVYVQQRVHVAREQARLQGGRLQARDLGAARQNQQPQLSGLVPRPEGLRLAFHHHAGPQDQSGKPQENRSQGRTTIKLITNGVYARTVLVTRVSTTGFRSNPVDPKGVRGVLKSF